jgi:hypothetical protein
MRLSVRLLSLSAFLLTLGLSGCDLRHPYFAEETIEEKFAVTAEPTVSVETFHGSVEVRQGKANLVEVRLIKRAGGVDAEQAARLLQEFVVKLEETKPNHIDISVKIAERNLTPQRGARVELLVPAKAALNLRTSNAPITVLDVGGSLTLRTANGAIQVQGTTGTLNLSTSNSPVEITGQDATITAESTNGTISFRGSLREAVHTLMTRNGRIKLELPASATFHLDAATTSGKIDCAFKLKPTKKTKDRELIGTVGDDPKTSLKLRTSNGNISITPNE